MKKFYLALFLFVFFGLSFFYPIKINAQTACDHVDSLAINPSSGTANTPFQIVGNIRSCNTTQLHLVIVDPGNPNNFTNINNFTTDASGAFNLSGIIISQTGQWFIRIYSDALGDTIPQDTSPTVTVATNGGPSQLACGSQITVPEPIPNSICPDRCPPTQGAGGWACGAGNGNGQGANTTVTLLEFCNAHPNDPDCVQTVANGIICNNGAGPGVGTALGCVPTEPQNFVTSLLQFTTGIGGGIALLLMIIGSLQVMTAAGNPEQIKKGRDQFVSAAIGLVFIILSVTILQIIGYDILKIPGFGR